MRPCPQVPGLALRRVRLFASQSPSALVLRRTPTPFALPFLLRRSEVVQGFDDWAERHDAASDLSAALTGGKWTRQQGVTFEPWYMPFWSFETFGSATDESLRHNHVYAGDMDAISVADACASAESLPESALSDLQPFERLKQAPIPGTDGEIPSLEDSCMASAIAWEAAIAQGAPPLGLRAVRLLYLPVWQCPQLGSSNQGSTP